MVWSGVNFKPPKLHQLIVYPGRQTLKYTTTVVKERFYRVTFQRDILSNFYKRHTSKDVLYIEKKKRKEETEVLRIVQVS